MDLYNRSAFVVTIVVALSMVLCHQYGYSYDSAHMHLIMGVTIIPLSLILEKNSYPPRFLYAPTWMLGFIPFASGLFRLGDWKLLLVAIPVFLISQAILGSTKMKRVHHAIEVTHKLLEGNPDELRRQIEENRAHHSSVQKPHSR